MIRHCESGWRWHSVEATPARRIARDKNVSETC
jgi:hypothetical protein